MARTWDYAASARRSAAADDYYRDLGVDPEGGGSVLGPSGLNMAFGRSTNRMLEGLIPHAGSKTLYQPQEQNDYLALHTGSGSVYDDPSHGGTRTVTGKYWANTVSPTRSGPMGEQFVTPMDIYEDRLASTSAKTEAAKRAAYQEEVSRIRRAQSTVGRLPPELQDVYAQMTPAEKKALVDSPPERQYASLASSPLRRPTAQKAGMGTMTHGDQSGINDYLSGGYGLSGTALGYRPTANPNREQDLFDAMHENAPVRTYTPAPTPTTKTALPPTKQYLPSPFFTF